jgi:methylated-DNA-[protein]-cysteine S-methyltransferase
MRSETCYTYLESPIGRLLLVGSERGLARIELGGAARPASGWSRQPTVLAAAARQLAEYFAGERRTFELRLAPAGTDFQRRVWRQLARIPFGATISYGELARRLGNPKATRAVGAANGANPLPIVLPCHRVIGADGGLTGYGGGIERKRRLLALERRVTSRGTAATSPRALEPLAAR